ncbi:MAG: carbonic anhydrase [Deltaproteobacteria bacterium]|nr:MAG: carbonic anhydrase [Deltaproteobacteria bacterium]
MKKVLLSVGVTLVLSTGAYASEKVHWGYTGAEAPENWKNLSPEFSACGGKNQSPINLTGFTEAELPPVKFLYQPAGGKEVVNNGHSIQVNYAPGSTFSIGGDNFELKQFHFHSPSENQIDGKLYPFEAHFVHMNDAGEIAVVAVLYNQGEKSKALCQFWPQIPKKAGETKKLEKAADASMFLPENKDYYYFNGSLTTPPCSEGVRWIVFKEAQTVSKEQINAFTKVMHHPNNRPVQPVNSRLILK